MTAQKGWGGPRKGAGRPGLSRVQISVKVTPEIRSQLTDLAKDQDMTRSALIEKLLIEALSKREHGVKSTKRAI